MRAVCCIHKQKALTFIYYFVVVAVVSGATSVGVVVGSIGFRICVCA